MTKAPHNQAIIPVRVSEPLFNRIRLSAETSGRSVSEEIVARLNRDFTTDAIMQMIYGSENPDDCDDEVNAIVEAYKHGLQ